MTLRLVAVLDVFLPDGTVRRGVLNLPARARLEADLIEKALSLGLITLNEARALAGSG